MATGIDNSLPEWVLDEHPEEHRAMTSLIGHSRVLELDAYLRKAVSSAHCKLGPKSFITEKQPKHYLRDPQNRRDSLLMDACKTRSLGSVMYFLTNYLHFIDLNHKEWILDGCEWILATPLHVTRDLEIARALIQAGADVNALTCCQRSPLHTQILYQTYIQLPSQLLISHKIKLVELLLSHGANVNVADRFGNTPLMASIQHDSVAVPKLLLSRGADCTCANLGGYTPMHIVVEKLNLELVKELLSHGASLVFERQSDSCESKAPPSAFMFASKSCLHGELSVKMVELLTSLPQCPVLFKADAWLLLGSMTSRGGKAALGADTQYNYWTRAVQLYEEHKATATSSPPIPEYGNRTEIRTRSELEKVVTSLLETLYQCLLIQERILGYGNDTVTCTLRAVIEQEPNLDSIEPLWFRYLDMLMYKWIRQPTTASVLYRELSRSLLSCHQSTKKIRSLLKSGHWHRFDRYAEFAVKGLELWKNSLQQCICRSFTVAFRGNVGGSEVIEGILNIIAEWLASDLETHQKPSKELELFGCNFILQHLVAYTLWMDSTILHQFLLFITMRPLVNDYALLPYLLQWGADAVINMASEEHSGYRPLHIAALVADVLSRRADADIRILSYLLEYGAHLDAVDGKGKTALEICTSEAAKAILTPTSPSALLCQAARAVVAQQIPFRQLDCLPETMKDFIDLHSPVQLGMR